MTQKSWHIGNSECREEMGRAWMYLYNPRRAEISLNYDSAIACDMLWANKEPIKNYTLYLAIVLSATSPSSMVRHLPFLLYFFYKTDFGCSQTRCRIGGAISCFGLTVSSCTILPWSSIPQIPWFLDLKS